MKRLVLVVLVTLSLGALLAFGLVNPPDREVQSNRIGKPAPAFEMPLFERYAETYGDTFELAQHAGTPMVVNFWASWCRPCEYEAPALEAAWQEYGDRVMFVGVDTQDAGNEAAAKNFLERHDLTFPNGKDERSRIGIEYGLFGVPETFFVRADGTLQYKHAGMVTEEVLAEQVGELLQ